MLQNAYRTLGFKKNMVYEIPTCGGGGEVNHIQSVAYYSCMGIRYAKLFEAAKPMFKS